METNKQSMSVGRFLTDWGVLACIVLFMIVFSISAPAEFCTLSNMVTILQSISITTVIAMGATFTFAVDIFDLSFASIATIGAALSVTFVVWDGIPLPFALLLTVLACMFIGVINSFVVTKLHIPSFLATLAMSFILDGLELTYSGGSLISSTMPGAAGQQIVMQMPDFFQNFGRQPLIIIIMVVSVILVQILLGMTKHGRFMYMVGANKEAARLSGVKVNLYKALAFILTGVFSAIGGIMIASRAGTVQAGAGSSFLMPAIAAVAIGQTFAGIGKSNAVGTFVGAALIGVVENGLYALSFPYYSIDIVKGLILLLALFMSNYTSKQSN